MRFKEVGAVNSKSYIYRKFKRGIYFILLQSNFNRQFLYQRKIHTTRLEYYRVKHGVKKNILGIAEHGSSTDVDFFLHRD